MAKRIFAALIIPLVLGLAASQTRAQLSPIAVDGCAKLARVIYAEVSAAAVEEASVDVVELSSSSMSSFSASAW